MKEIVEQILARLRDQKVEVPADEVESRLRLLVEKFGVPEGEAARSVVNYFLKEHGIAPTSFSARKSERLKVGEISGPGRWIDLEVKVVELWEPSSSAISQTGLVGDDTGTIKFVKWTKSDLPELEPGKSYHFKNVVTDEFQGRFSVKLNRTSGIEELASEVVAAEAPAGGPVQEMKISEIGEAGRWIDLRAKVVQLWDPTSETISQTGLIGDDSGVIKFVKWAKSELADLAEGESYLFKNVVTDEFEGRFSIKLNRTSGIEPLEEEIEVSPQEAKFTGAMVDVQKGSGLIKRCPICRRMLTKGVCGEHGKQEGTYDLRIKAVLDDGVKVQEVLINRERTESLVGIEMEEAKTMAMEALDHEVVRGMIQERLLGRYYTVSGPTVDRYILVETISQLSPVAEEEVRALADRAKSEAVI
ncbi:replication protein A [Methanotrichaceae archaeon M04Ac]|uniref:Replication protein A n=1 Tax=Candidatus Methanocrinis alkalitolerans TaxID=3033395 RepID=A0ABT5XDZ9_9EURY|nr:replication protein A [Candidatus Methanocrinis alkalitolerans]MCR3882755.1 replication protein A [Methanothrix sp.]MDF0592907.1 replication protein A [Candidatus Methanocrinis alkalitolerans]